MNAKLGVDDCHRVGAHLAGADRVVGGFRRASSPSRGFRHRWSDRRPARLRSPERGVMAGAVMIARAMRTARTVSSASGGDDRKLKLIAGGRRGSAAVM